MNTFCPIWTFMKKRIPNAISATGCAGSAKTAHGVGRASRMSNADVEHKNIDYGF